MKNIIKQHFLQLIQFKVRGVPMHFATFAKQEQT